ncbi:MAG: hypothetical protein Q9169_001758 [Polycauliona sp. 2 TL-2023]
MTVLLEADILGPVHPKLHSDDWPIHRLRRINVVSRQTQKSVSLLESHKDHAVQVTGVLDAVDFSRGRKISEGKWRNKRIEISNVSFWAFSEDEQDRSICLWAGGKAGWFELHDPLPQYQEIFNRMNEAVSMLYHLADKYRRSRKNQSNITTKDMNRLDTYNGIEARLHPQRQSKHGRTKPVVVEAGNSRKQTSTGLVVADEPHRPTHIGRSTRRRPAPEIPKTPKQPRIPNSDMETSGEEEYDSSGMVIEAGTKRKSRSILQPKGSKFSKKAASRQQNLLSIADESGDSTSEQDDEVAQPGVSPLAAVSQREQMQSYRPPRKTVELEMVVCDIPSDQPQGPGDLWTCQFENCNRRVHEASKPKGKALITSHFQEHARQAQEKIDLALAESRPYLPVSNLVRRIQQVQNSAPPLASAIMGS